MREPAVAMLARDCASSRIVYHALVEAGFRPSPVVVEAGRLDAAFLRRRVRKLGVATVLGQVLFRAAVVPALRATSKARLAELERTLALDDSPFPEGEITRVDSVNSDETLRALQQAQPTAVVVHGTRIIAPRILSCVSAPFLNMHAGITPMFRGVHGGYWARVENLPEHCGVTVHLVDEGIDTGNVLGHAVIAPGPDDNFVTYPLLQLGAGLPVLLEELRKVLERRSVVKPGAPGASRLRTHPTLWQYAWHRVVNGVK